MRELHIYGVHWGNDYTEKAWDKTTVTPLLTH